MTPTGQMCCTTNSVYFQSALLLWPVSHLHLQYHDGVNMFILSK
uniref:Uncharacterized protein n=1 Tax=Anguilla anguilla TaxID=7936 RepID=A0A0E9W1N3_ANGAN